MSHQIHFHKARAILLPRGKGAHRDLGLAPRTRSGGGQTMQAGFALGAQEALRCGNTHGEQLAALFFREAQVPVLFQQRHQRGQGRQEPFGTHVVGRLPGQKQGLLHRLDGTGANDGAEWSAGHAPHG